MPGRRFHTLDVFTDHALAGNPLAVVHDSQGLDTGRMQAITREFNLSETVFVLPPDDPVNTAKIRIFTPGSELPFAGHPTVGTAVLLAQLRAPEMVNRAGIVIALEEKIGLVKVEVSKRQDRAARGVFAIPRLPVMLDEPKRDPALIAKALGLDLEDIETEGRHCANFAAGVAFTMVPLKSLDALARAQSSTSPAFEAAFGGTESPWCYLYVSTGKRSWRTRMFAPSHGVVEDPATGAAAAAFAGALMAFEKPADGRDQQHIIMQGVEMGRPSEIVLTLDVERGALREATIGGGAVIVSEGTIDL
jgi:trans-2,3-dihydro-3-hydroxyanthranilate isomerase